MFALLTCVSCAMGYAQSARYLLQQQKVSGREGLLLRLYDRRTHHLLWKLTVEDVCCEPVWSADHQAVAILVNRAVSQNAKLLIWKAGMPLQSLPTGNPSITGYLFDDWDGILDMSWSPDKTQVMLRAFYSGGSDVNAGQLLCYVLDRRRFYGGPKGVRRSVWTGSRQVRYWRVSYNNLKNNAPHEKTYGYDFLPETKHSWLWHCP